MPGYSPRYFKMLFLASLAAALLLEPAAGQSQCARYGRHAPYREVSGTVKAAEVDWWGDRHIIVADAKSGCRVFVRIEDRACVPGKKFSGYGRLKSLPGEGYDAAFRFFREPAAVCG